MSNPPSTIPPIVPPFTPPQHAYSRIRVPVPCAGDPFTHAPVQALYRPSIPPTLYPTSGYPLVIAFSVPVTLRGRLRRDILVPAPNPLRSCLPS